MTINQGDWFTCDDASAMFDVTEGQAYQCIAHDSDGDPIFIDDGGDRRAVYANRTTLTVKDHGSLALQALQNLVDALIEDNTKLSITAGKTFAAAEKALGR